MPATPSPDALLTGASWAASPGVAQVVSFSFAQDGLGDFGHGLAAGHWAAFNAAQQASARQALAAWAAVAGLSFVEVPDRLAGQGVDLRFRLEDFGNLAMAGLSYGPPFGAVALSLPLFGTDSLAPSATRIGFSVLLHEIGHGLGLKHPFEGDIQLDPALANTDETLMAYTPGSAGLPQAPRPLDALAAQELYGAPGVSGVRWQYDAAQHVVLGQGGAGDDVLAAPAYGAVLAGGGGNDTLLGGAGLDSALFSCARADAVVNLGAGSVALGGCVSQFSGVEALDFSDGHLALTQADPAGVLARLYGLALGRAPDMPGLANWLGQVQAGLGLEAVAQRFLASVEFQALHPGLDDAGFAALLGAQGADAAWAGAQLAAGQGRAAVLLAAAEAATPMQAVDGMLAPGFWVPLAEGETIARLYHVALGRAPDAPGWAHWFAALEAGESLEAVAEGIWQSAEFRAAHGAEAPDALLAALLADGLGHAASGAEVAAWAMRGLEGGALLAALVQDPGVAAALQGVAHGGILFA